MVFISGFAKPQSLKMSDIIPLSRSSLRLRRRDMHVCNFLKIGSHRRENLQKIFHTWDVRLFTF